MARGKPLLGEPEKTISECECRGVYLETCYRSVLRFIEVSKTLYCSIFYAYPWDSFAIYPSAVLALEPPHNTNLQFCHRLTTML
jgi:hypothetical protein